MSFLTISCQPKWIVLLLLATNVYWIWTYVPVTHYCDGELHRISEGTVTVVQCQEPTFTVDCRRSSVLMSNLNEIIQCKSQYGRLHRFVDGVRSQRQACAVRLGPLADYTPETGCVCDYQSQPVNGRCRLTDASCRKFFGTGAVAKLDFNGDTVACTNVTIDGRISSGEFLRL